MKIRLYFAAAGLVLFLAVFPAMAQKVQTPDGSAPWILGTIEVGEGDGGGGRVALKGMAIKVGEQGEAAVAYDLDLCRIVGAWTGKFIAPVNGNRSKALGNVIFTTDGAPGFSAGPALHSPAGRARCKGFYVNGSQIILKWDIGGTEVLEMPAYDVVLNGGGYFTRTLRIAPSKQAIQIVVAGNPQPDGPFNIPTHRRTEGEVAGLEDKERVMQSTPWIHGDHGEVMIWAAGDPDGSVWRLVHGELALEVPPRASATTFQIAYWPAPVSDPDGRGAPLFFHEPRIDLPALIRGRRIHALGE